MGETMKEYVLVTGACINTGVAIVEKFAGEGKNVVFTGRNVENVELAEKNYREKFPNVDIVGYKLEALRDDGSIDEEGVHALFASLDAKDALVRHIVLNAADQGIGVSIFTSTFADFSRVLNTNILWNYCLIESAARRMRDNGGGSVIFINSNTSYRAIPDRSAYSASKSGQLGLMRGLALDLGKYGIRVNAVLPGMIRTDRTLKNPEYYRTVPSAFTPLGDIADGTDIADAVWYFAEYARNATGAELVVDGGNTIQLYPIIPKD